LRPWNWPSSEPLAEADRLAERFGMPRPVAFTLARRGVLASDDVEGFLNPRLSLLADPSGLDDMGRAVERLWRAVDDGETVFVHGDYDVDGITGAAFLTRTLRALGAQVVPFVPDRTEGYGLSSAGIAAARDAGATVMLTVDNGIRALNEVDEANAAGIDVVILDHHEPADRLPAAYAVVDPRRRREDAAFHGLAGVGVAAKFIHAVAAARPGRLPGEVYKEALQLVALGTIADSMPLTGENRIFVRHGLAQLEKSRWPGVSALKAVARMDRGRISATDVAFFLAPRLNAAGRMGVAGDALGLLLAEDPAEAYRLADQIERQNGERRKVEQSVMADASARLRERGDLPAAVVLWSDDWPVGVIGIAASRVLDRYHRPAFLIALDGDTGRGSARSRKGFSLPDALDACAGELEEYGGHTEAAGFRIRRDRLEGFQARMESLAGAADLDSTPAAMDVDAAVTLDEMNADCVDWLQRLSPFGRGNPEPLFGAEALVLAEEPSVVGKRHLRLAFAGGAQPVRAIAFNLGDRVQELGRGQRVDAVFHASFDSWRGGRQVQLVVRDLRTR
jgi:single-stranded-DNA-specific exonuclease